MIKLAVFDLDETILTTDKQLTDNTLRAIFALRDKGVKVTIATGRAYELMKPYAEMLKITEPIIINNGAVVKDLRTLKNVYEKTIDHDALLTMMNYAKSHDDTFALFAESGFYGPESERLDFYRAFNKTYPSANIPIHVEEDIKKLSALDVYKLFVVINDEERFKTTYQSMKATLNAHVTQSMTGFLDILPKGTNKGEALDVLLKHYGYSKDEVIVFGDNDNDSEMLERIPFSFAMKNATIKAKNSATFITLDENNQEGVAKTLDNLERFIKIKEGENNE